MSGWLRWYIGTCGDGKFQIIARNASVTVAETLGVWAALLEDASNAHHRGWALRNASYHTSVLQLADNIFNAILHEMELLEMVQLHENKIRITNWNKAQYETDTKDNTNTERQRRWRERKRQHNGHVTAPNGQITDPDTDLRALRPALRPAHPLASAPNGGALAGERNTEPDQAKPVAEKQPNLYRKPTDQESNDYRSPPKTKSDNPLEPIPERPFKRPNDPVT